MHKARPEQQRERERDSLRKKETEIVTETDTDSNQRNHATLLPSTWQDKQQSLQC